MFTHVCSRYYADTRSINWPPEVHDFNRRFTKTLESIKKRHDPTVTTVAQGVLEWKRRLNARNINLDVQHWLDRFYLSRIGIRFLIGQRRSMTALLFLCANPSTDIALNTLQPHQDYVGIICTSAVSRSRVAFMSALTVSCMAQNVHDIVQEAIENARCVHI